MTEYINNTYLNSNNNANNIFYLYPNSYINTNGQGNFISDNNNYSYTNGIITKNPSNYYDTQQNFTNNGWNYSSYNNNIIYSAPNNTIISNDINYENNGGYLGDSYYKSLPSKYYIDQYGRKVIDYSNQIKGEDEYNSLLNRGITDNNEIYYNINNLHNNQQFIKKPVFEIKEKPIQSISVIPHIIQIPNLSHHNYLNNLNPTTNIIHKRPNYYNNINNSYNDDISISKSTHINNFNKINDNLLIQNNINNINQKGILPNNSLNYNTMNNIQHIKNIQNNGLSNQLKRHNSKEYNINTPQTIQIKKRPLKESELKSIIYKDIGIINLGNTCFMNACLQILIHCPNFIYKFFEKRNLINKIKTPISYYFYGICYSMMDTVNTKERCINISYFKNAFGAKHSIFQGYAQNDSQEFCRVLLEDFNTELNEVKTKGLYKVLNNSDKKTKVERDKEFDLYFKEREKSIITDLFYAQIISTFICKCKSVTYSFQKILDLPLLLPEKTPNIGIRELLRNHFKPEIIDFESKCENCQKVQQHKKELKITRPPEILILSLQRIDMTKNKNECLVTFPPILDMSEFIDKDCGFDKQPLYNLFAIVNHLGSIDFGHYHSYIKFKDSEDFYDFNDSTVTKIGRNINKFPNAYALFYIKNKNYRK